MEQLSRSEEPVSYTHLDVYKRQVIRRAGGHKVQRHHGKLLGRAALEKAHPVSYTHLDVYKRQPMTLS